jgi:hypothetical protein
MVSGSVSAYNKCDVPGTGVRDSERNETCLPAHPKPFTKTKESATFRHTETSNLQLLFTENAPKTNGFSHSFRVTDA